MLRRTTRGLLTVVLLVASGCGRRADPLAAASSAVASVATAAPSGRAVTSSSASALGSARLLGSGSAQALPTAAAPAVRVRGLVGRYLPGDCREGRIYLDVAGLVALVGPESAAARAGLVQRVDEGGEATRALAGFAAAGLDPWRDLREIGICARGGDDVVFAADLDLGRLKGDLRGLVAGMATPGAGRVVQRRVGELEVLSLEPDDGVLARVAPSVLVAARTLPALQVAAKGTGAGFAEATRHLAFVDLAQLSERSARLTVERLGERLAFTARLGQGRGPSASAGEPQALLGEARAWLEAAAKRLDGTPWAPFAADLRAVELGVEGGAIEARLTLPAARLREFVAAAIPSGADRAPGAAPVSPAGTLPDGQRPASTRSGSSP